MPAAWLRSWVEPAPLTPTTSPHHHREAWAPSGHALGAAGAIEAVAVVLSMDKGLIPPTAGYATPDPDMPALDLVTGAPAPWEPGISMSNSFGFGGHNGSVVLAPA